MRVIYVKIFVFHNYLIGIAVEQVQDAKQYD